MQMFEKRVWRFLLGHMAAGIAASVVASSAILWFDVAHLGSLIATTDSPVAALVLLYGSLAAAFGSVAVGAAIMLQGEERDS